MQVFSRPMLLAFLVGAGGKRVLHQTHQQLQQLSEDKGICCCAARLCHDGETGEDGRKAVGSFSETKCCKVTHDAKCPTFWSPWKHDFFLGPGGNCDSREWIQIEELIMSTSPHCQPELRKLFPRFVAFSRKVDWSNHHIDSVHAGHWAQDMMHGLFVTGKDNSHGKLFSHPPGHSCLMLWELPERMGRKEKQEYLSKWSGALNAYTDWDTPFTKDILEGEGEGLHEFDQDACSEGKTVDRLWGSVSTAFVGSAGMHSPLYTLLDISAQQLNVTYFYKYEVAEIAKNPPRAGWKVFNINRDERCDKLVAMLRIKVEKEQLANDKIWARVPFLICEDWHSESPPPEGRSIYFGTWFKRPFTDSAVIAEKRSVWRQGFAVKSEEDLKKIPEVLRPLHTVKNEGIAKELLAAGANVHEKDDDGRTPLHLAQSAGIAKELLAAGADVDAKNDDGLTPLHYAQNEGVAKELLAAGAKVDAKDDWGSTPLHVARSEGIAKELLAAGAKVDAKGRWGSTPSYGKTPLHVAQSAGIAKELLAAGAKVDAKDDWGSTPLHHAQSAGIAKELLAAGANVYAKSKDGFTPLHFAQNEGIAKELLAAGAKVDAKDDDGKTPLDYAKERSEGGIAEVLRAAGAV